MNKYEARRNYIDKVGKKLLQYQSEGYLLFDEDNEPITKIEQRGFGDNFGLNIDNVVYYSYESEFDNGYHTPLKELKKMISKFKIVHPKHIKTIKI